MAIRDAGDMPTMPAHLDESQLAMLVGHFHDRVRADPLLGPAFNPVVEDWDAHKVLMASFCATVALRTGHYRGNPLAKHRPLPIGGEHFQRWLALWHDTARELLDPESGALMVGYAERIGDGMRVGLGLSGHQRGHESGIPIRAYGVARQEPACRVGSGACVTPVALQALRTTATEGRTGATRHGYLPAHLPGRDRGRSRGQRRLSLPT